MIKTIKHNNNVYPAFQAEGNAMQFAKPFAQHVCEGDGVDVGCNRLEWVFCDKNGKMAIPVDPALNESYDALHLPIGKFDYIISSHMLEHTDDWVAILDYWATKIKDEGVLFLYLPHPSQTYWLPWNNRKHKHVMRPEDIEGYLFDRKWSNIFVTGADLNNSFIAMATKNSETKSGV